MNTTKQPINKTVTIKATLEHVMKDGADFTTLRVDDLPIMVFIYQNGGEIATCENQTKELFTRIARGEYNE